MELNCDKAGQIEFIELGAVVIVAEVGEQEAEEIHS